MNIGTELEETIKNILNDLKQIIENDLMNGTEANKKLNDEFMRTLDDSSSTDSSDDEEGNNIRINKKKSQNLDDTDNEDEDIGKISNQKYLKTKDELTLEDFEPVEYFEIHLEPNVTLERIGKVISKVDNKLIVIQSFKENPNQKPLTLDEETYLFDSNKKFVGKIFETFGPVVNPFYVVRFNSLNDIENRNLNLDINSEVFIAQSNQYTKYVFNIDVLRKQKGSDASWSNDNEPPTEYLDYSDDEQEKNAKKQLKGGIKINGDRSESDPETKIPANKNNKKFNSNPAQKRRHDQRFVHQNANQNMNQNQSNIPNVCYYPGNMYPPHPYFFYPNAQMPAYPYPPQMYPPNYNYFQQPMPINQQNPHLIDKNVVKKKF